MSETLKRNIIVSADDYGIRKTSESILRLAKAGKLNRVSVLINYVSRKEVNDLLSVEAISIDLHLELIHLIKSGEKEKESPLFRGIKFFFRYAFGFVTTKRVAREWRRQIELFREMFGWLPDGLNSHEHIHYFPAFFRLYLSLAKEYGIPYVRFGEQGIMMRKSESLVGKVLGILWRRDVGLFLSEKEQLKTSDFFTSFDWFENIGDIERRANGKTIEVTFHPERKEEYVALERLKQN